uniref:NADH-quinone oxidoreductase subunit M n=1 Tax=Desulfobacca acetoxidans TaxID=60893 RepID=A0A7C3ZBD3_9BACT
MSLFPWLTLIIFLPFLGSLLCLAAAHHRPLWCRVIALGASLADLGLVILLFFLGLTPVSGPLGTWLLLEDYPWIPSLGISYSLGLDGLSLLLILLTTLLTVLSVLVSWRAVTERVDFFHFLLLLIESGILGVFLSVDLFLFYLFWEIQLIPMFFLVGVWGHTRRLAAALKFFLYTISGSLLMLVALIGLYLLHGGQTGHYTFSLYELMDTSLPLGTELWLYAAFVLAFAVKVPIVPIHAWLPDTHTEAPTAGSVILAGLLLKTGAYALVRLAFPLFPEAAGLSAPLLGVLGLAGLFYAAWLALAQTDVKRLVAYSSIAHMGLIVIGIGVWNLVTLNGAVLQMLNHGLSTGALFLMVGMLDERLGTRNLAEMGGLWGKMPVFSAFFLLFAMSAMGLPGLNNFVGELLILIGTFQARPVVAILGFLGMVLTLIYVLRMVQEALFGEPCTEQHTWDINLREGIILSTLALALLFIGLYPQPVLQILGPPLEALTEPARMLARRGL